MTRIEIVISTASIFLWILRVSKDVDKNTVVGCRNNNFNFSLSLSPTFAWGTEKEGLLMYANFKLLGEAYLLIYIFIKFRAQQPIKIF